jgi:hypothetical protein
MASRRGSNTVSVEIGLLVEPRKVYEDPGFEAFVNYPHSVTITGILSVHAVQNRYFFWRYCHAKLISQNFFYVIPIKGNAYVIKIIIIEVSASQALY